MTKTLTTAADRDALIAEAAEYGVTITRTAKDFFTELGGARARVTPTQIRAMIAEEQERRAAFEAADARASDVQAQEPVAPAPVAAEPDAQPAPAQAAYTAPAPATEEPAKVVIKYGPPCGGALAHLAIATSEDARNPLIHVDVPVGTRYKSKGEAAAAGRGQQTSVGGWLAFMAHDKGAEQFWALATVDADGRVLDVGDSRCVADDPTHGTKLTCTVDVAVPGGKTFVLPSTGVQVVDAEYLRDGKTYTLSTD